jgi:small-conductance mechanosensitive channel
VSADEIRYEIRSSGRERLIDRFEQRVVSRPKPYGTISCRRGAWRLQGFAFALLALATASVACVYAPSPASGQPVPEKPIVTPAAIPGARIAEGIETCRARLSDIEVLLGRDPRTEAVQAGLPDAQQALAELSKQSWSAITSQSPSAFLLDVEDQWDSWKDRLQTWQRTLADLVAELDTALTELGNLRHRWEETRDSAAAQQLPPQLTDRIESTLVAIQETVGKAGARREELLALQGKVAETQTWVDAEISAIEKQRADQRKQLLELQSPPLWKAFTEPSAPSVGAQATQAWRESARSIAQFVRDSGAYLAVYGVRLLVILATLLWLRARVPLGRDDVTAAPMRIFSRPLSAAFLLALLPIQFVAARPPVEVRRLVALLAAVPILRLLPGTLFGRRRLVMLALTAAYILTQIVDMTAGFTLLERLVLLAEALLGMLVLHQIITIERRSRTPAIAAGIGLPLLVIALGANIWGSVAMARVLTHGTIFSAYLAVIFAAVALVIDGILVAVQRAGVADSVRIVQNNGVWVRQQLVWALRVALTVWWVSLTLDLFQLRDSVLTAVTTFLTTRWAIGSVALTVGGILRFGVTLWVAILLSRAVGFVLAEEVLPRLTLRPGVPDAIATGVRYTVVVGGFFLAVAAAGVDFGQVALLAGALSVGLGFGLQNVVNNFVSGLILLFERPIKLGDVVEIGPTIGNVRRIGIRSSTIHTSDGADVIVPNGDLISQRLVNWTYTDRRRRIDLPVSVTAPADPSAVTDLLVRVAAAHPAVLAAPAPAALMTAFAESKLDFSLRFWTERFEVSSRVRSEVAVAVRAALQEAGFLGPIPAPANVARHPAAAPAGDEAGAARPPSAIAAAKLTRS